jgi:hypothetical protein
VQDKLVAHHSAKSKRGAKTTFINENGDEKERDVTVREAIRHMKELLTYGTLTLQQQKLDAGIQDEDDEEEKTLNDFVTPVLPIAADRMEEEAAALGLSSAAELPMERAAAIFEEEQAKYEAAHPKKARIGRKKPFEIPADQRNDWIIPQETQLAVMARLVDMALPDGDEYKVLSERERLMASGLLGKFCRLGQDQQFLNQRLHDKKPETDWDELDKHWTELEAQARVARWEEDEKFYQTHERSIPLRRPPSITEGRP